MNCKYLTAESREAAEAKAEEYFGCNRDLLTIEVVSGGEEGSVWQILASTGPGAASPNANASYGIYYEEDAVYLELYKERGEGSPTDRAALASHIGRKNIAGLDLLAVQSLLVAKQGGRVKIAPAQQEFRYGEEIVVEIRNNDSEAWAKLLAPEQGGALLGFDAAKQKVIDSGVTDGIDDQKLRELLEVKIYDRSHIIAETVAPVDGENGRLVFEFSTDERTGRPREIGGGRVDYRELDLYVPVTEGQLLVTRILATEGTPGVTIKGKEIKQKPGKEANMPKGKNVNINEDKTEMRSMYSGMVEFVHGSVNVSNVYSINGDVDLSVGNIEFDGSIHISGSVRAGHVIKATGGIVVGGTVEASTIISEGSIEVKGGMQGADKGRIEAGGSVNIMYVERGTVVADGSITLDACIHSNLAAGGTVTAKGRRGCIIGGHVGAADNITATTIGSVAHANTEIEVGVMPKKRERITVLEKELERLAGERTKLDQLDMYLTGSKEKMDPETWDKLFRSGVENRKLNEQSTELFSEEMSILKYELEHATNGKVHVLDTVFPGTRIIIASDMYKVNNEIQFSTFRHRDGEVVYGTCEIGR